jgi:D-lactate dehydrogenase
MWRLKSLADPEGVLSPGVLLNRDPGAHLRNLKTTPPIEEVATNCVECGFCEPVCPSRHLTLTPRQRIVVRREMARQPNGSVVQSKLLEEYEYEGLQTCAADGSCGPACPLAIDTGKLVKELRARQHGARAERRAEGLARHWARVERLARVGLRTGPLGRAGARLARAFVSDEVAPDLPPEMPHAASGKLPATAREGAAAVYVPACVNRIFGRPRGAPRGPSLPEALVEVSARAGAPVWIPDDAAGHCCGVPWSSKGFERGHELMANRTVEALWRWSGEGELPVVIDASSCALGLGAEMTPALSERNRERHPKLTVLDSVAWAHDRLLPSLTASERLGSVAVHPTCSTRHLGLESKLRSLASAVADDVQVPIRATCCGMAGDRGLLHPELTRSATADQAAELQGRDHDAYLCSNRTCEIGLQQGTGEAYESVLLALERATRPTP